jgi:hypothetical protein
MSGGTVGGIAVTTTGGGVTCGARTCADAGLMAAALTTALANAYQSAPQHFSLHARTVYAFTTSPSASSVAVLHGEILLQPDQQRQ